MSNGGMIRFNNEGLSTIQDQTNRQQNEYVEIWGRVHRKLLDLVEQGLVDAQIASVLTERDQDFRRESAGYDESVTAQNAAMRNVQNIGNEGGAAMVRSAAGGR